MANFILLIFQRVDNMRTVAILAIAFAVFAIAAAQTSCSDAFDDFSTSCLNADGSTPFCVSESASFDITANRKCSECRPGNSCDCPLDHYCVGAPGAVSISAFFLLPLMKLFDLILMEASFILFNGLLFK